LLIWLGAKERLLQHVCAKISSPSSLNGEAGLRDGAFGDGVPGAASSSVSSAALIAGEGVLEGAYSSEVLSSSSSVVSLSSVSSFTASPSSSSLSTSLPSMRRAARCVIADVAGLHGSQQLCCTGEAPADGEWEA